MPDKKQVIERLKKAIEVLESDHIAEVQIKFRGIFDDVRYYDAVTHLGTHKYLVKIHDWFSDETGEMERWAKCNCASSSVSRICRHIIKASEIDADMLGRDLWLESFASYNAHEAPARKRKAA